MSDVLSSTVGGDADGITNEFVKMNRRSFDFVFGTQKALLDEMISINNDVFERACGELNVATEFISRLAESHSAKAVLDACEDCRKHQADLLRRDNERLLKCGQRFLDRTAGFLTTSTPGN